MDSSVRSEIKYEPRHVKTNSVAVRPAKTQISLGINSFCWFCHVAVHIFTHFQLYFKIGTQQRTTPVHDIAASTDT